MEHSEFCVLPLALQRRLQTPDVYGGLGSQQAGVQEAPPPDCISRKRPQCVPLSVMLAHRHSSLSPEHRHRHRQASC